MITTSGGLGIDYSELWENIKKGAEDFVTKDVPEAARKVVETRATAIVQPTIEKQTAAKAARVVNKGNIALTAGIGALAGLLIAGGTWQRRTIGGGVGAILGGLAGLKIGLVSDS